MSESVYHHRALGIHPGAFVQPTEPSTAGLQDGVLWIDTAWGEAPYPVKKWDAATATWVPVQMDATGYPLPSGHRLDELAPFAGDAAGGPRLPLTLSVNFNDGTGVVALQMTYTWVGPGFGESLPAPIATLTSPPSVSLWRVNYATSETAPSDAYGGQFYVRQGTGDPDAPTWGPWLLWDEVPASAWSGGFSSTLAVPAAFAPADALLAVDPPEHNQYQASCVDCVDSGPRLVSRSGGTPSWARYLVAYTWVDAHGAETRAQTVALDSSSLHGGVAASTAVWQPREKHFHIIPAGAVAARWYVNPPLDTADPLSALAGWLHAADVPVVAGDLADWTLAVTDVGGWPTAALPTLNNTCRSGWLRLRHASARSHVQQNEDTIEMRAGNADRIHLPLPTIAAASPMIAVKDEATGLLAYCAAATASPAQILTPVPVPVATVDTCVQMRCGVSFNCTTHLVSLYDNWARWLNPLFAVAGALAFAALLEEVGGAILGAEVAESTVAIWDRLKPLLEGAFGVLSGNLLPLVVPDTRNDVQKMLFCALSCEGGVVPLSSAQIDAWRNAQAAYGGWAAASLQGDLALLLTEFTPLQDWLTAASTASPTHACDAWTCP